MQLEQGLIASSDPYVFSDGQRLITPPFASLSSPVPSSLNPIPHLAGAPPGRGILEEAHSQQAEILARRHPHLAATVIRELEQGVSKWHDGAFGADASSQRRLADDLDRRLNTGALGGYRDRHCNFIVEVGPVPHSGSRPCFCFKVSSPHLGALMSKSLWVTVCFSPREFDLYAPDDFARARAALDPLSRLDVPVEARLAGRSGFDSGIPFDGVALRAWESATPWRSAIVSPGISSRFSLKSEFELRAMNLAAQREHSMLLYLKLGGNRVGLQIPGVGEDLVGWCLGAQRLHAVDPVAEIAAVDKLDDAVGTKKYTDARGHQVTTHTKVDASGWEVRTTDVDGSTTSIAHTLTPRGGKNSPIKRTVYDPYVEGFRAKSWQDRLEGLTPGGPGLWGVRRSSMLDDPAWSADLGPRSPISMNDALWKLSVRAVV